MKSPVKTNFEETTYVWRKGSKIQRSPAWIHESGALVVFVYTIPYEEMQYPCGKTFYKYEITYGDMLLENGVYESLKAAVDSAEMFLKKLFNDMTREK
jgi:hypothetical protein